jgi:hypothetical protein
MRLFACFILALALAGCESKPENYSYAAPPAPGGRMCVNQCRLAHDYGLEACDLAYRHCVADVQAQALKDYEKYTREQFDANEPMDLYLSDFERMTPCTGAYDRCNGGYESGYRMCYANCGGTVTDHSPCLFSFLCF